MEFFAEVDHSVHDTSGLKQLLTIARLPELCGSISSVISDAGESGVIYAVWGEFAINREELKYGVRFSLPQCLNALAWTITMDEECNRTAIHCTINRQGHDEDFIDSIEEFVNDWSVGLANFEKQCA